MGTRNPSSPFISVIICVYNDWNSLENCLGSLSRQQDAPTFEIIVVDDGSSESVPELLKVNKHLIQFIRQPHAGIPTARNTGIRAAVGDVFLFTDSDCILDNN